MKGEDWRGPNTLCWDRRARADSDSVGGKHHDVLQKWLLTQDERRGGCSLRERRSSTATTSQAHCKS